jgi:DNA-binding HxlR family transcriptional regulator
LSDTHINVRTESSALEEDCGTLMLADNLLTRIGDKWTVKVVISLSQGSMRYNQIFRRVGGVSQRMLTLTLKNLERDGLVSRTVYPTIPPRVDYALTERGQTLIGPLYALWNWAQANYAAIEEDRLAFDARRQDVEGL